MLVDSGFRCHLTSFSRTAATTPSQFVSRLRKYLKSKRVTSVTQLGTDRVIEITFSDGQYRLFLEFFAAGNIVVTDADLNVLVLLRQVSEGDEDVDVKLGGKYLTQVKQNYHGVPPITPERIKDALQSAVDRSKAANQVGGKKAKRAKGLDDLGKALSIAFPEVPSHLLEHVFRQAGLDGATKADVVLRNEEIFSHVVTALDQAVAIFNSLGKGQDKGYIIAKIRDTSSTDPTSSETALPEQESLLYDDFHPFRPAQFETKPGIKILEFDGFNRTVDEFYSSIESQRLESRLTEREQTARRKIETTRAEHQNRLGALQHVQELHIRKAQAIEANTHWVEEACAAVNGLIGQGMDWVDIGKLIENEQKRDNVVAQMVKLPLKLEENTVTLLLDEPGEEFEDESDEEDRTDDEDDSDGESDQAKPAQRSSEKRLAIDIDLALSPWANARQYYDQKKTAAVKEKKTMEASAKALQSAEKKIESDLKKGLKQEKAALRVSRKQFWFEKFLFFISSDGYLVIGGKDAQQNELLYRRYLKKGDAYVHADLQGASSVIVKNNPRTPDAPIPPSTLSQAGALTVCTSTAWDSKAVMGAWWVESDQVSKTAPTGEYLKTGGFVIRGRKNILPPSQLLLGFGVMWLISEESRANHGKHRLDRTETAINREAEGLAHDTKALSLDNGNIAEEGLEESSNQDQVIPDVENAAEEAEQEISDDDDVAGQTAGVSIDEDDDGASSVASDIEEQRSNPLQAFASPKVAGLSGGDQTTEAEVEDESGSEEEEEEDSHDAEDATPETVSTGVSTPISSQTPQGSNAKSKQLTRGKRSKAKRAQKKYAEQDEEDRALAMQLLGSDRGQDRKQAAEIDKAAREAKAQADKERRAAQHAKAAEKERQRRERLEKAAAEGNGADGVLDEDDELSREQIEQERQELLNIDRLVPVPQPGDELLAAIPMVAPWTALTRQKYKVKLQPGTVKKGKVVREIVTFWTGLGARGPKIVDEHSREKDRVWRRELDLLKDWRVEEIVGALPVKGARIVQGGGLLAGVGSSATAAKKKNGPPGGGKEKNKGKGGSGGGRGKR